MAPLPSYLELASLLNTPSIFTSILSELSHDTLKSLLPYLNLSTQLRLAKDESYSQLFGSSPPQVAATLSELIDYQRDFVCSDDCPPDLKDRYLVDVLPRGKVEGLELLKVVPEGMKVVFDGEDQKNLLGEIDLCHTVQDFRDDLLEWSGGLLANLDWNNVVLGGGSVLSIVTGSHKASSSADSDLDLFLYGLKPDELVPKVRSIVEQIQSRFPHRPDLKYQEVEVFEDVYEDDGTVSQRAVVEVKETDWDHRGEMLIIKGHNAITLIPPLGIKPRRPIQIILTSFPSIFDALGSFDLDCCCIGFNGSSVVAVPRALRAIQLKANLLDVRLARKQVKTPSKQTQDQDAVERASRQDRTFNTSASRTIKYLSRGYAFALAPSATKHLETTEDGRKFDEMLKAATARAHDQEERRKKDTDALNGLDGLARRVWYRNERVRRNQEGGIDTDYGPMRNAFMISLTSKMLKEEENETIAKSYTDWRNKLRESIVRCLEQDSSILPGYEVHNGVIASEIVPHVASFDMDCILASQEDGLNGLPKVVNNQLLIRIPRSVLPTLESADEEMLQVVESCSQIPHSPSSTPNSWIKVDKMNAEELHFNEQTRQSFDLALTLIKTNPDLCALINSSPNRYVPDLYPGQLHIATSLPNLVSPRRFLQPLVTITGREVGITSPATPYVYRVLVLASLFQFKGLSPELDVIKDTSFQLFASLSRASVNLSTSAFPFQLANNDVQKPKAAEDRMEDVQQESKQDQAEVDEAAKVVRTEQVMDRLDKGQNIIAEKAQRESVEKELGLQRRERVGELDEARKGWLDKWVRGEVML